MSFSQSFGPEKPAESFEQKFFNPRTLLRSLGVSLDVKTLPYEETVPAFADWDPAQLGTVVAVDSGKRLLELRSDDGTVTIKNAKFEYLDDKRIRIEFDRTEQA